MKVLICVTFFVTGAAAFGSNPAGKVPISVTQFTDKSEQNERCNYGWDYWHERLGSAFREMLVTALVADPRLEILERETIHQIYDDEINLINSENSRKTLKKGEFKKAKLTLVGSVSEFEFCAKGDSTGVDVGAIVGLFGVRNPLGSVKVGVSGAKAKAVIDLRVIENETGKIITSVEKEGVSEDSGFSIEANVLDTRHENAQPIAKAARDAIRKAAEQVKPVLAARI